MTLHRFLKSRLAILALVVGPFAGAVLGADDPTRFLLVTNWYATFTHSLTEHGDLDFIESSTGNYNSVNWHFNHSIALSCQLAPDPQGHSDPEFLEFFWKQNDSASVHFSDSYEGTTYDPARTRVTFYQHVTVNDVGLAPTNFILNIDLRDGTYQLRWDLADPPFTSEITFLDTPPFPGNIGIPWDPEGASMGPLPATGMVLQGQSVYPLRERYWEIVPATANMFMAGDPFFHGDSPLGPHLFNSDLVLTWSLTPELEELEVVVEPEDYDSWLPQGYLADPSIYGNSIKVRALLQKKGGGAPTAKADKFLFELADVSRQPGVCMNSPAAALANTELDLQFHTNQNFPPLVSQPIDVVDALHAETLGEPSISADVNVSSFDFGAYGTLTVTAVVGGSNIVGYLKTDPTRTLTDIPLPKRAADSFIADAWKQEMRVNGAKDDDDLDDVPTGDEDQGDGLTVYEEYRGFSENGKHRRTKPLRKDLFVCDTIGSARSLSGILLWQGVSRLDVHHHLTTNELNVADRLINFNTNSATPHKVAQHGLILMVQDPTNSASRADNMPGFSGNSTPASKQAIKILGSIDYFTAVAVGRGRILTDEFASTVAHELAHGCSAYHHGENDEERTWVFDGYDLVNGGGAYQESGSLQIFVLNEAGYRIAPVFGTSTNWIGMPRGQHSGMEDCIMRYDCAQAYDSVGHPGGRYWVEGTEFTGLSLCTSMNGTGVNAPGRSPEPRYGPAASNRGNCAGQICVNDAHAGSSKHER